MVRGQSQMVVVGQIENSVRSDDRRDELFLQVILHGLFAALFFQLFELFDFLIHLPHSDAELVRVQVQNRDFAGIFWF